MPSEIYLLKVGMTMTEGTVQEWFVPDGQQVNAGDLLYQLETEKVNMEVEAESSGTVRHLVPEGTTLEPGEVVGWIFNTTEEIPDVLPQPKRNQNIEVSDTATAAGKPIPVEQTTKRKTKTRVKASPAARKLARERGIDLDGIQGSGPGGRITLDDIPETAVTSGVNTEGRRLAGMRKTIADRMFQSLQTSAQLTMTMSVAMDRAVDLRQELNNVWEGTSRKISITDLIARATVLALKKHPIINSHLQDDKITEFSEIHLGIAVSLNDGLIVPVIQNAHTKNLVALSEESVALAEKARRGKLTLDEISGGTFTISSLGMYGVDVFTPILNPPQAGILGVGGIRDVTVWEGNTPICRKALMLSLTWDHRVLDGAPAAEFLASVCSYLEAPTQLLLD